MCAVVIVRDREWARLARAGGLHTTADEQHNDDERDRNAERPQQDHRPNLPCPAELATRRGLLCGRYKGMLAGVTDLERSVGLRHGVRPFVVLRPGVVPLLAAGTERGLEGKGGVSPNRISSSIASISSSAVNASAGIMPLSGREPAYIVTSELTPRVERIASSSMSAAAQSRTAEQVVTAGMVMRYSSELRTENRLRFDGRVRTPPGRKGVRTQHV